MCARVCLGPAVPGTPIHRLFKFLLFLRSGGCRCCYSASDEASKNVTHRVIFDLLIGFLFPGRWDRGKK